MEWNDMIDVIPQRKKPSAEDYKVLLGCLHGSHRTLDQLVSYLGMTKSEWYNDIYRRGFTETEVELINEYLAK